MFPDVIAYGILLRAQGHQAGREAAGGRLPARAGGPAAGRDRRRQPGLSRLRRQAGRARLHHLRPAEPLHLRGPLPHAAAQGQPARARRSSRSSCRSTSRSSTGSATLPYVDPQRIALLRPLLRRQDGDAHAAAGERTTACRSARPTSTNGSGRTPRRAARYSYVWTGEYEIFEFDLGSTFNYAEMAALIAPRPFMVERGHFDGVAPDETRGLRVRQGALPLRGQAGHRRPLPRSSGSSARTRSTARGRSSSCTST